VEHFIRFNTEKHRLADLGEIPEGEWEDRGDRLTQRWRNIARREERNYTGDCRKTLGIHILEQTTYEHCEPIAGEHCEQLYMTAGHYHRLADDDEVWWHPDFHREEP
jgi:hypothetical protein